MCIAAIIFKPVSRDYLKHMHDSNPHGGGVAWEQDGAIRFKRGLGPQEIHDMQEAGTLRYPYLLHFRWATHGGKHPELTHPFPLGPRALMGELDGVCSALLIHNGTWNSYDKAARHILGLGNYEMPEELLGEVSDTAIAAWLAQDHPEILDQVMWATATAEIKDGPDGVRTMDITTRGTWEAHEDNWYSNLNWLPYQGYHEYTGHSSRDTDWMNSWNKWYFNENTGPKHADDSDELRRDPEIPDEYVGVDWDEYFKAPFANREDAESHLTFEQYVQRFRPVHLRPGGAAKAGAPGAGSGGEFSWDDYLQERYPATSVEQIDAWAEGGGRFEHFGEEVTARERTLPAILDSEIVSEDFETVNEVLGRLAAGRRR